MTDEPAARGGIEGYPTGLSWYQHHRVARVVASASTDAEDCAQLLSALGVHPADGLPDPSASTIAESASFAAMADAQRGLRRKRSSARWTRE
jgi:hypothetical protein